MHDVSKWGRAPAFFNEPGEAWQGDYGTMMEFDFLYPDHLHDAHSDLPFGPELMAIPDEWLNPLQLDSKRVASPKKLVGHLHPHYNYKATVSMALLMERNGLIITKVHRAMDTSRASTWKITS
jgi:hypothetical protein